MRFAKSHSKNKTKLQWLALAFVLLQISFGQKTETTANYDSLLDEALVYQHQNNRAKALESLEKAAQLAEEAGNFKNLLDTHQKFALLYLELGEEEMTEFYAARATGLLKDLEYPYGSAVQKLIEASLLYKNNNNFQARQKLEEARTLNNDKNLLNHILLLEADIFLELGNLDQATTNYNALLVNSDLKERAYLATKANIGLAKKYVRENRDNNAVKHAEAALELATKHLFYKEILLANNYLKDTYQRLGDYQKAFARSQSLLQIKDSLFNIEKEKIESKTAEKIKSDQLIKTVQELEVENAELSQSASRSEITAILASAFLTIISILAVSLFRNNQIKLKTNDLLQTKNEELETARDAAVSAMKAKTNFLSTVTHELRTPLYAVTGLTHILLEEDPAEHQKEHLKSLKFSGDYLLNFINDILQINKIDAEKLEPLEIEFKLKKVLTDVIDSLQQTAKEQRTKILLDFDNDIPLNVLGDPLKLSQIIMNLVGNALKFTKDGQVVVQAKLKEKREEDITVYIEVNDNGIGISEEQQKNIFNSFEQGSVQINREYGGTGLGLTIVKSLLGLFNSTIHLKSELGIGSTFFFDLNLKVDENEQETDFEITAEEFEFEGLHILIVEDNKINQVITKKMLSKKGISCDIANNGNEAIDAAQSNRYDAILMDIHMPGISGIEATVQIRKFNATIPIIALTAISMEDSLDEFYSAGCNAVVTKPFKPEVFYQKIGENVFKANLPGDS
ncbi:histidine kinase [Croceitalea dokdonensis DOKDO 023]|uniref:histidine kinase n=1 Tax=Croceitalea dokdonensis DOKDO 023 TaxID=1300341 RepID=A0A0N8H3Y5_9FLAO|nr:response regulator [Croceitalea dokdonensis]KPM31868.1 histidine kinase [Croceitalea dokdonensis DOKDO 023]